MNTDKVAQRMTTTCFHDGAVYVESNGLTVWVNNQGKCIARFGQHFREYHMDEQIPEVVKHENSSPTLTDWNDFVTVVEGYCKVKIGAEHRPQYIRAWSP